MRSLYLTCACILAALSLSAQQNFVPGTVLLRNGDSLTGRIDYRKWDKSPLQIVFREGGTEKIYKPADIKGFRIAEDNETYLSVPARLDITNESISSLSSSSEREIIEGEHFFRVVMNGRVKLLLFTDNGNREHMAVMENDSITQLLRKVTYINEPGAADYGKLQVNSHYRQQLANLVGECLPSSQFERLDYSDKAIRKVLQKYLSCRYPQEKAPVLQMGSQARVSFGIMAGASYNTYEMTGSHYLRYGQYKNQIAPVIGVFMDVPLTRDQEKFSWNNELVYTNRAFSSRFPWYRSTYEADVNLKYIQFQTMLKYTYPRWKVKPFANLGVIGALKIGGKDELTLVDESGAMLSTGPALGSGREFFLPFTGGIGVRYERLHVEVRRVVSQNLSPHADSQVKVLSTQLIARYTLF